MDPFTIATLGLGGLGIINSAVQGDRSNDLAEEALALERARERDRQRLRGMFMDRIGATAQPEDMLAASRNRSAEIFGADDPTAPGRANPFAAPLPGGYDENAMRRQLQHDNLFGWGFDAEGMGDAMDQTASDLSGGITDLPEDWWTDLPAGAENMDFDINDPTANLPPVGSPEWEAMTGGGTPVPQPPVPEAAPPAPSVQQTGPATPTWQPSSDPLGGLNLPPVMDPGLTGNVPSGGTQGPTSPTSTDPRQRLAQISAVFGRR